MGSCPLRKEAALPGPWRRCSNLMFNLGVATTQVCESVAVATQTPGERNGGLNAALSSEKGGTGVRLQVKRERSCTSSAAAAASET